MCKSLKIDFVLIVICFLLLSTKLFAQANKVNRQDSLKALSLIITANDCIKSASANCNQYLTDVLKIPGVTGSAFLKSLCYSSYANAERRNRSVLLFKYDSLSIGNARNSKNDSLLITKLLVLAEDFCMVNKPEKAKHLIDESYLLSEKYNNTLLKLLVKYKQGFYYFKMLDFTKAADYYRMALSDAEALNDEYWIAKLHRSICFADAFGYKKNDTSISIFNALEYFKKTDAFETADCLTAIGHVYRVKGNTEKASSYFNEAALIYKNLHYYIQEAEMYILIAEHNLMNKQITTALGLTERSEKIFIATGYNAGKISSYLSYGRLYGAAKDKIRSDFYFNKVDSFLKRNTDKKINAQLLYYKIVRAINNGDTTIATNKLIDSAAKMIRELLSKEFIDSLVNRVESNEFLLSKAEATDLKNFALTGKVDAAIWKKKTDLGLLNPYTGDLPTFNSSYNELFNRQTTEMETRYRTKIKDDSLRNVMNENKISQLKIVQQNWLIVLVTIIALATGVFLYQKNRERKKAVQEKKTIELLKLEADHRVKNTLNTINTIVRSVKSQSTDRSSFELLEERVEPLMILYDMLNKKNVQDIYLQNYFEKICSNLKSSYNHLQNINVHVDAPVMLDGKKAGTVGLIVNELVTNAFKHAFKKDQPGKIWVACKKDVAGGYNLHVSDSGIGFKETVVNINSKGLLQVKALAEELSAKVSEKSGDGVLFEFYFM